MSKKNLDRLFQEKFKDFEVKPKDYNWDKIQSKLKEDDKKIVVVPIWLKLIGIAATLLLMFGLGQNLFNDRNQPQVVDTTKYPVDSLNQKTTNTNNPVNKNNSILELDNNNSNTNSKSGTIIQQQKLTKISNKVVVNTNQKPKSNKPKNQNSFISSNISNTSNPLQNSNNNTTNYASNTNSSVKNAHKVKEQDINIPLDTTSQSDVTTNTLEKLKLEEDKKENSIEDAIAKEEPEDIIEEENDYNRWSVNINAAPVYYNSFGTGSHISEEFNSNNKSGEINTGYGLKVGYALNEKLSIRSGVSHLKLSFDTDDVIVYENVLQNPKEIRNISMANDNGSQNMNIMSANNLLLQTTNLGLLDNVGLSQRISYYEIPMEIEYALINKKVRLNIIGGFSTFILEDNELVSEVDGFKRKIGEANNINNVSFTSNFGIGFNYNFSKAIQFNLEPTFKYQINAYDNTSGNFNPYIIGLYTGLSYKF